MKKLLTVLAAIIAFIPLSTVPTIYCGPYTASAKINLNGKSFRVIEKLSFDNNNADNFIHLTNCHDIVIRLCKFKNGRLKAIRLDNCYNIRVDSNYFENTYGGLYAFQCMVGNISFQWNELKNIKGSDAHNVNSACQFNTCSGPNITMSYNNVQIDFGAGTNPNPGVGDIFNFGKTNGTALSPAKCWYNQIIGGGTGVGGNGFVGILAGDLGGSYQDIRYNTLVNTGYMGIQQSGGSNIIITLNKIVGTYNVWSRAGITSANNGSGIPMVNNEISHNEIHWIAGYSGIGIIAMPGIHTDTVYKAGIGSNTNSLPIGWSTNVVYPASSGLNPSVLPADLWVSCTTPPPLPVVDYVPKINTYIYGNTIIPKIPIITSAPVTTWAVSPAFPAGITLNTSNGVISGKPTVTHAVATYVVTATGPTGSDTVHLTMTVNKANLTISANDIGKYYRTPNPTFTVRYSAWLNGDSPASLLTPPVTSTTALFNSLPGRYPITVSGATSNNYNISYVSGWLYVNLPVNFIKYKHYGGIKR